MSHRSLDILLALVLLLVGFAAGGMSGFSGEARAQMIGPSANAPENTVENSSEAAACADPAGCCVCHYQRRAQCEFVNKMHVTDAAFPNGYPEFVATNTSIATFNYYGDPSSVTSLKDACTLIKHPTNVTLDCDWQPTAGAADPNNQGKCISRFEKECRIKEAAYRADAAHCLPASIRIAAEDESDATYKNYLTTQSCMDKPEFTYDRFGHGREEDGAFEPIIMCVQCAAGSSCSTSVVHNEFGCATFQDLPAVKAKAEAVQALMASTGFAGTVEITADQASSTLTDNRTPIKIIITATSIEYIYPSCQQLPESCLSANQFLTCAGASGSNDTYKCCATSPSDADGFPIQEWIKVADRSAACPPSPGECPAGTSLLWESTVFTSDYTFSCSVAVKNSDATYQSHRGWYAAQCSRVEGGQFIEYNRKHDPSPTTCSTNPTTRFTRGWEYTHNDKGTVRCCAPAGARNSDGSTPTKPPAPRDGADANWCSTIHGDRFRPLWNSARQVFAYNMENTEQGKSCYAAVSAAVDKFYKEYKLASDDCRALRGTLTHLWGNMPPVCDVYADRATCPAKYVFSFSYYYQCCGASSSSSSSSTSSSPSTSPSSTSSSSSVTSPSSVATSTSASTTSGGVLIPVSGVLPGLFTEHLLSRWHFLLLQRVCVVVLLLVLFVIFALSNEQFHECISAVTAYPHLAAWTI